jgi:hypothetical protein
MIAAGDNTLLCGLWLGGRVGLVADKRMGKWTCISEKENKNTNKGSIPLLKLLYYV